MLGSAKCGGDVFGDLVVFVARVVGEVFVFADVRPDEEG